MVSAVRRFAQKHETAVLSTICAIGGLLLVSRLMLESWRTATRPHSVVNGHRAEDVLVWTAYLALWIALAMMSVRSRRSVRPNWVVGTFILALAAETLGHMADSRSFGAFPDWLVIGSKVVGAVAATLTAIGLPFYLRRLQALAKRAKEGDLSVARLAATTESSLDAMFMFRSVRDSSGSIIDFRFTFLNRNAERLLRAEGSALVGKRLGVVYPAARAVGRIEQYTSVVESSETLVIETESPLLISGDRPAYCRLQIMKLEDGVLVTCADLTNSRMANQELKRALAFNKAIVLSSPFSIIVTDLQGVISAVNPAAERMLLYREDELRGRSMMLLHDRREVLKRAEELSAELNQEVLAGFGVLRAKADMGMIDEKEWTYVRKNGTRLPVQLTIRAVEDESGAVIGVMGVSYDLTERKEADEYIYHLAHHDTLTGLPGRSLLRDRLEMAIERGKRFQTIFAVLMIDLDHFKRVNDSLGHQAGDVVLCEAAERLKSALRKIDTISRFGGDEFIVLVSELRSRKHADEVARKIISVLSVPIMVQGHSITITASIGISMYPDCGSADELIKNADIAMYRSKALGRNGVVAFTPDLGREMMHKLSMESALRAALERNEFSLVYQPQVSLETHVLTGVEALIRWHNPDLGLVMPNDFVAMAEETGLIVDIGAWAIRTACLEIAELKARLGHDLIVAVNVSPRQVHQKDFQATIEQALQESGLDPSCLEVEITEHLLMRDSEESLEIIERIQSLGVTTAIDDFGTGFSNMSYITRFKVDRLKIDRGFVSKCVDDENSLAVTTAIIALAHSLKMQVVAEGVETLAQARMLRELDCDFAQGYLYSKPISLADLTEFALSGPRLLTSSVLTPE